MGLLPWSPLGGGWLTGKYKRDEMPTGATRLGENPNRGGESYAPRNALERTWAIIGVVEEIAKAHGVSMAQVALAWTAAQPRSPQSSSAPARRNSSPTISAP